MGGEMTKVLHRPSESSDQGLERAFIERERNRFAGRALSSLVLLNGAAALVLLTIMAQAPEATMDRKLAVHGRLGRLGHDGEQHERGGAVEQHQRRKRPAGKAVALPLDEGALETLIA